MRCVTKNTDTRRSIYDEILKIHDYI